MTALGSQVAEPVPCNAFASSVRPGVPRALENLDGNLKRIDRALAQASRLRLLNCIPSPFHQEPRP
jgi:hypothetical protein